MAKKKMLNAADKVDVNQNGNDKNREILKEEAKDMKPIYNAMKCLFDTTSKLSDIDRLEKVSNVLNNRLYTVVFTRKVNGPEFEVFDSTKDKIYEFPLYRDLDKNEFLLTFLSKESYIKWNNKRPDKNVRLMGALTMNFVSLLHLTDGIMKLNPNMQGIGVEIDKANGVVINKGLVQLLHEKIKSGDYHSFVPAETISEDTKAQIIDKIVDYAKNGMKEVSAIYYITHNDLYREDTIVVDCPDYYFLFYSGIIANLLNIQFELSKLSLTIKHIGENKLFANIDEWGERIYQRDSEVTLLN